MSEPRVSVIIPNYNHAPFLPRRIESVLNQTVTDIEVIILDDCSPDNSREIILQFAKADSRITTVFNEENTGSTFYQWNKGVALAKAPIIWIAESDDYADPKFLETLLPKIEPKSEIGIAFCQSNIVDESDKVINSFQENYDFIFQEKAEKWQTDFVVSGKEECAKFLVYSNTIPNASGILMRKSVYEKVGGADESMKLNGDWYFYAKMLLESDLAYSCKPLNFFRLHTTTQRERAKSDYKVYDEIITVLSFIKANVAVEESDWLQANKNVGSWWAGSLFFQKRNKTFVLENRRLYKYFKKYNSWLLVSILITAVKNKVRWLLTKLGLYPVVKQILHTLFPTKFYKYTY